MSPIFSLMSHRSSVTLADLPRICDDPECLVPFGPACIECSLDLNIKERARYAPRPSAHTTAWVEEVQVNKHTKTYSGEVFVGGADEENGSISSLVFSDDDDEISGYVSDGDEMREPGREHKEEDYEADADRGSKGSHHTPHVAQSAFRNDWSVASSSSSSKVPDSPSLPERLDPWLTGIFNNTLQGQRDASHFVGGADEQDDDRRCSLCRQVPAEDSELHRLKCEFAHHEAERREESVQNQVERWGR